MRSSRGQLQWLPASCCRAHLCSSCTQTNMWERVPPDALEWCQLTLMSFLQQGLPEANVSSTSTRQLLGFNRKGLVFPGASCPSPVTKNVNPRMPLGRGFVVKSQLRVSFTCLCKPPGKQVQLSKDIQGHFFKWLQPYRSNKKLHNGFLCVLLI